MAKSLKQLQEELEKVRSETIIRLRSKWEAEAIEEGLSFADVIGKSQPETKGRPSLAAKYANPVDPSDTWSGQGYPPRKWGFCWKATGKKNKQGKDTYEPLPDYKKVLKKKGYELTERMGSDKAASTAEVGSATVKAR